jgi:hypothetical protein
MDNMNATTFKMASPRWQQLCFVRAATRPDRCILEQAAVASLWALQQLSSHLAQRCSAFSADAWVKLHKQCLECGHMDGQ